MNPSLISSSFAEHSLAAYVAPLIDSRRVAVVGPNSGPLAERVRDLGAKSVLAIGGVSDQVPVRPLSVGVIEAFRGRLDCVLIADASVVPFARLLEEARRALGHDGVLIVATPAGSTNNGLDYHSLREALTERFTQVHLLGRGAFVGFTIASLEQSPDDITLDTSLMPEDPTRAEAFVAIASDSEFSIDPLAIVQVPLFAGLPSTLPAVAPTSESTALHELREEWTAKLHAATVELEQSKQLAAAAAQRASESEQRAKQLSREVEKNNAELSDLRANTEHGQRLRAKLDAELKALKKEASEREQSFTAEISALEKSLARRGHEADELNRRVALGADAVRELTFQLDQNRDGALDQELHTARARNAELAALHAAVGVEASRLAAQNDVLRDRVVQLQALLEARDAELKQLEFLSANSSRIAQPTAVPTVDADAIRAEVQREFAIEAQKIRAEYEAKLSQSKAALAQASKSVRGEIEANFALEHAEQAARTARAQEEADAEAARLRAQSESHRRRAEDAENALNRTLAQLRLLESAESEARARVASAETRLQEALARGPVAGASDTANALAAQTAKLDELARLLKESDRRAAVLQAELTSVQGELQEALDTRGEAIAQVEESRVELSRQLALNASIDDRVEQLSLELEGARKGFTRRIRELEREVEQLIRALEVATAHATGESDGIDAVQRELGAITAERDGLALRLDDAEAAYRALSQQAALPANRAGASERALLSIDEHSAGDTRAEQLLATLAETAARLAATEESLAEEQSQSRQLDAELQGLRVELVALKERASSAGSQGASSSTAIAALEREAGERELLVRSLVAQLEDRDLRLRALERRLVEEVERARRTESEIWELELRARDQRILLLQRDVERHSSRPPAAAESQTLAALEDSRQALDAARARMENVRSGISSILVEGRGAAVAHELVSLLRSLEDQG
jgi:hypothetical protein